MDVQKSMTNICSTIKLMSSDGQIFETDTGSVKCMEAVMTMLSAVGGNEPNDLAPIPLPNVRSHILRKLLTYANYHKNDRQQRPSANNRPNARCAVGVAAGGMSEHISHWDSEFLNVPKSELFEIIAGANYLEMGGLMNVACQTVANMLKCRTPDEMRTMFNIPNDFVERNAHHARNFDDTSDEDEQHQQQLQQQLQQQQQQQHIDVGNAAAVAAASAAAVAEHRQQQYQRNRTLARTNVINNRNRNQRLMSLTRELDQQHLNLLRRFSIDQAAHHQHYGMGMRRLEEIHEQQQQQQQRRQRHEQQQQQQLMQQHRNQQQRHQQQQQQQQHMRTPYGHQNRRFLRHLAANNNNSNNNHNELHIFVDNTNTNNYHYNFDNANDNDNLGNQTQQQQRRNNRNRYRRPRNQQNRNALL